MILKVTFKTPDAVDDAIDGFFESGPPFYTAEERIDLRQRMDNATKQWVEFGEYIEVEFDTEKGTATVLPVSRR